MKELETKLGHGNDDSNKNESNMAAEPAVKEGRKMPADTAVDKGRKMPARPAVDDNVKTRYDLLANLGIDVLSHSHSELDLGKLVEYMEELREMFPMKQATPSFSSISY